MKNKIEELINEIKEMLEKSEAYINDPDAYGYNGYNEGYCNGECNAYEFVLEKLEDIMKM